MTDDATYWKARCEAAERVLDLIDNQRYTAQADNEKLRGLLEPLLDHYLHCYDGIHDQLALDARAALKPSKTETPNDS